MWFEVFLLGPPKKATTKDNHRRFSFFASFRKNPEQRSYQLQEKTPPLFIFLEIGPFFLSPSFFVCFFFFFFFFQESLFELTVAASYLDIPSLWLLLSAKAALLTSNKSAEKLRKETADGGRRTASVFQSVAGGKA